MFCCGRSCWSERVSRSGLTFALAVVLVALSCGGASAQTIDLRELVPNGQNGVSLRMVQMLALITVLSVAPGILVTVTCFTRFVIALSFLRSGLGLPSTPSNLILVSLALFMTYFVMQPTFDRIWTQGVVPLSENKIDEQEAYRRVTEPIRDFMKENVRPKDLQLFVGLIRSKQPEAASDAVLENDLRVLVPAFMISELRRGFEIGFLIALPFLVIDLIVATIVMSMGMMMLPPSAISLPFKVLFFVLIDGWNLLVGSLVRSFG